MESCFLVQVTSSAYDILRMFFDTETIKETMKGIYQRRMYFLSTENVYLILNTQEFFLNSFQAHVSLFSIFPINLKY